MSTNDSHTDKYLDIQLFGEANSQPIHDGITASGGIDPRILNLSYSSINSKHSCPRKFELDKKSAQGAEEEDTTKLTFAFGHTVGDGIASLMIGTDYGHVLLQQFLAWPCDLLEENEKQQKSFFLACLALYKFNALKQQGFLQDYEVFRTQVADEHGAVSFLPAVELSFRIDCGEGFKYRGHVDIVLQHNVTGALLVLEIKTTSAKYLNPAQYKNSSQAVGYSIVLDKLAPGLSEYDVLYLPYLTHKKEFEPIRFHKSLTQRALWLQSLILEIEEIKRYEEFGFYPQHGESCMSWGRPCKYIDVCTLSTSFLTSSYNPETDPELQRTYTYEVTLEELIEAQLESERIENSEVF